LRMTASDKASPPQLAIEAPPVSGRILADQVPLPRVTLAHQEVALAGTG
jgi:hypothetical protein